MGALFHQFVGTPVNNQTKKSLEDAMRNSLNLQPAIEDVEVNIDFTRLEDAMSEFDYTSLTGDMLDVKIHTKVDEKPHNFPLPTKMVQLVCFFSLYTYALLPL